MLWFDMLTSTNSWVNLKGEFSNPRFLPGDDDNINPKSICIICPSESNRIFPLCLKIKIYHSIFILQKKKKNLWFSGIFCECFVLFLQIGILCFINVLVHFCNLVYSDFIIFHCFQRLIFLFFTGVVWYSQTFCMVSSDWYFYEIRI